MAYKIRMGILGALLVVALCGLAWEYLVVLPSFNKASDQLTKLSKTNNAASIDDAKTMVDVKEVIGKAPSESKVMSPVKKEDVTAMNSMFFQRHDKYNYYHVMPGKKPQTITVVYRKPISSIEEADIDPNSIEDEEWLFWTVHINTEAPSTQFSKPFKDGETPERAQLSAAGPGVQQVSYEEDFKNRDKNGDGKLTGDEIDDALKLRMEAMDKDKNGEASLEEFVELQKALAPKPGLKNTGKRKGGNAKGKGGKGRGKGKRPPSDDPSKTKAKESGGKDADPKAKKSAGETEKVDPEKSKDETKKSEPKNTEPEKTDAKESAPKKVEAEKAKDETKKAEPEKTEPKSSESEKSEAKGADPKKAEAEKSDSKEEEAKESEAKKNESGK